MLYRVEVTWQGWVYVEAMDQAAAKEQAADAVALTLDEWRGDAVASLAEEADGEE